MSTESDRISNTCDQEGIKCIGLKSKLLDPRFTVMSMRTDVGQTWWIHSAYLFAHIKYEICKIEHINMFYFCNP